MQYLSSADLLLSLQSGFRPGHSTETAVLRVLSDILQAVDCGDSAALILLDLSAAFNTVDHSILLQRLQTTFSIHDAAHRWFHSYLSGWYVRRVPQGSVLGPILFVLYTAYFVQLIETFSLSPHLHADDTQVYGSCAPTAVALPASQISECVDAVVAWMKSNRLQLNSAKTDLWCATSRRRHQLPMTAMLIDGFPVTLVQNVHDLGIYIDGDLSMRTHVQQTTSSCFAALHQLRQVCRLVPTATFQTLTVTLVNQWLDYGNSTLVNAAARLIFHLRRFDHITDALVSLHWLRVPEQIQFKIAMLTYRVLHGNAPWYLGPLTSTVDVPGRRALRYAGTNRVVMPPVRLATAGSRAFPVGAAHTWNSLLEHTVSASTLQSFKRHLKTFLL